MVLKFVPVMVTVVPTGPEVGVNEVIVGAGVVTVKLLVLVAVLPATVTEIVPVVAPMGTVVAIEVAVLAVTTAVVPLNLTVLLAGVVLKFVPVMVSVVPTKPEAGVKLVMMGRVPAVTMKTGPLVMTTHPMVNRTLYAPFPIEGTVAEMVVVVTAETGTSVDENFTTLSARIGLKSVPVMVIEVPVGPDVGETETRVGR